MRSHAEIVREFGAAALARHLNGRGFEVKSGTPQRWAERNSIPGEYWNALSEDEIASLEELARAADSRRDPALPFEEGALTP